jgi:hypothetical protein
MRSQTYAAILECYSQSACKLLSAIGLGMAELYGARWWCSN